MIKGHRRLREVRRHDILWKVMEGQGRSKKVKEGHGWSFPNTRLTFQVRKIIEVLEGNKRSREVMKSHGKS